MSKERATSAAGEHALLRRYFAEIGHIPVLSVEEERALARRMRESEQELRSRIEPLPSAAQAFVARWRAIRADGRVTGLLSHMHEPPARDRSAAIDRSGRQLERLLAERSALGRRSPGARALRSRIDGRVAARMRAAALRPELLHEILAELRQRERVGAEPEALAALDAAEVARQRGHEIKGTFIRHNLRLVVHQAKSFRNYGVPFLDLIQEGTPA